MTTTPRPRIGVIGTGWWATQVHIPALLDEGHGRLTAVADTDPDRLASAARRFGIDAAFTDPAELCRSGLVDGVVVAVPHAAHAEVARTALAAGLHVLIEKPLTLTAADAWNLVATADRARLHLVVGCTFQFTRTAARVRQILRSGAIGELLSVSGLFASMVEAYYRGRPGDYAGVFGFPVTGPHPSTYSEPALSGGGQAQAQVSHAMGMVLWATGRRVDEVSAYLHHRDLPVDLADGIAYRLDNGAVGTMSSTGSLVAGQPQQQELRYYGTEGFLLQDLRDGSAEAHYNDGRTEVLPPLPGDEVYPAAAPVRVFAGLIAGSEDNPAPGGPAALTVEFLEAAYRSARLGRPVRVAELTAPPVAL